ncbi:serine/arginine-rich splicing factor SC35-like [Arachis duranensis]|uniref:Serine/arginine-rich splicing factor SC35-like n=1 Tax=Arachis duranensis TaxID=130453 RepID=A0A6P4CEV6_ARADU|nr:serine/arginine-rich splicing factor SC35-like [Arachis duranensis]
MAARSRQAALDESRGAQTVAQQPRQAANKRTRGGRKPSYIRPKTSSKASSQPEKQSASGGLRRSTRSRASSQSQPAITSSQPNSTNSRSKPTSSSTRPKSPPAGTLHPRPNRKPIRSLTQQPPAPKEKGAASSS